MLFRVFSSQPHKYEHDDQCFDKTGTCYQWELQSILYACRGSYLVFAWLKEVNKSGQPLQMNWHPFAIQMDDPDQYWKRPWKICQLEIARLYCR